ncbi:MAG: ATP-binding protein [Bacteroidota bacterium]
MAFFGIDEAQILERLRVENPWWVSNEIDTYYRAMDQRLYFPLFSALVQERSVNRAVVLMGPRRVGKTVMIFHTIQQLIENGVDPQRIFYVSIETPILNGLGLEELFRLCRKAVNKSEELRDFFVFFDEVQYLKEWEIHLKSIVDLYNGSKFIVSGSAAAALKLKSNESGAGRFTDFTLPPLTFHEYIHLKKLDTLITSKEASWEGIPYKTYSTIDINQLNQHFIDYINFGGYPEVSLSPTIQANPGRYIKGDIVDKVLLRDLPSLYGIQDIQELNALFTAIAFNTGNEFSYEKLAVTSGVSKNTIKKYLSYLEAAFLLRKVNRIDLSGKKFKRVNFFKIYLTNPSLRTALFAPIGPTSAAIGNMVETAIYSQWFHRYWYTPFYARGKEGEVDIVGLNRKGLKPVWAVEIKWSDRFVNRPRELKSLGLFLERNKLSRGIVTSITVSSLLKVDDYELEFVPAALYCYTVGKRTLEKTA